LTRDDLLKLIRDILADLTDQDDLVITEATVADDVTDWDSINHVRLLLGLESELGIHFETDQVSGADNVGALMDLILARLT
jgi:acyl carrier protein